MDYLYVLLHSPASVRSTLPVQTIRNLLDRYIGVSVWDVQRTCPERDRGRKRAEGRERMGERGRVGERQDNAHLIYRSLEHFQ